MNLTLMYGLIAISVICASIIPRTLSLWKLGTVFLSKWICFTGLNTYFAPPLDGVSFFFLYTASAYACFSIHAKYRCETSGKVGAMYLISAVMSIAYTASKEYTPFIVAANSIFIAQAITIIWESFYRANNNNLRNKNIKIQGKDRRSNRRPLGPMRRVRHV